MQSPPAVAPASPSAAGMYSRKISYPCGVYTASHPAPSPPASMVHDSTKAVALASPSIDTVKLGAQDSAAPGGWGLGRAKAPSERNRGGSECSSHHWHDESLRLEVSLPGRGCCSTRRAAGEMGKEKAMGEARPPTSRAAPFDRNSREASPDPSSSSSSSSSSSPISIPSAACRLLLLPVAVLLVEWRAMENGLKAVATTAMSTSLPKSRPELGMLNATPLPGTASAAPSTPAVLAFRAEIPREGVDTERAGSPGVAGPVSTLPILLAERSTLLSAPSPPPPLEDLDSDARTTRSRVDPMLDAASSLSSVPAPPAASRRASVPPTASASASSSTSSGTLSTDARDMLPRCRFWAFVSTLANTELTTPITRRR
mmetsp:Transcript_40755/g.130049  ORF Transcript_40755/g.130049 Transcript_40755/m.130049 type:complete len:372 (+) Transcript_40755:1227-2342(+)